MTPRLLAVNRRALAAMLACVLTLALAFGYLPACSSGSSYTPPQGIEASGYTDLGEPDFEELEATLETDDAGSVISFEDYAPLDLLGRCQAATACLGQDLMPTKERAQISSIKPSGWQRIGLDFVDGGLLYNRCHLIAFSLADEDLNDRNLVTGTRQMNLAMAVFEQQVCDYIKQTGNHVLYRVTPVFEGAELVCRGVQMEALSVEDDGAAICFNVYIPNEQAGVEIDYLTGDAWVIEGAEGLADAGKAGGGAAGLAGDASQDGIGDDSAFDASEYAYVLNTRSRRFHLPTCDAVSDMSAKNRQGSNLSRDELIAQGYQPCGACKP